MLRLGDYSEQIQIALSPSAFVGDDSIDIVAQGYVGCYVIGVALIRRPQGVKGVGPCKISRTAYCNVIGPRFQVACNKEVCFRVGQNAVVVACYQIAAGVI